MDVVRTFALMTALAMLPAQAAAAPSLAAKTYRDEGVRLIEAKRYEEAVKALRRAVKFSSDYAEAWTDLGRAQLALQRYDDAAKAFQGALLAKPDLLDAQFNLALALRKASRWEKSAEAYRVYLQQRPQDADAHYALAETLRAGGDALAAADAYERYAQLETKPDRAQWIEHAKAQARLLRGGPPAQATTPAATSPAVAPTTTKTLPATPTITRAAAAAPPPAATASLSLNTAGRPTDADPARPRGAPTRVRPAAFDAGIAALNAKDYQRALGQLQGAVASAPGDALVLAALGSAHLGLGDGLAATEAFRKASSTAAPAALPGIRLGLAESFRIRGEDAEAAAVFKRLISDPATPANIKAMAVERLDHVD